jgi:hypothetical protein
VLRTRWPWLAGLVAAAMWAPNLVWQARHDWPVLDLAADIADEYGGVDGRIAMVLEALVMYSPVIGAAYVLGIVQLLRRPEWARARVLAWAFLVVLAAFLVTGGKGYYLGGLVPPLVAAGCTYLAARWSTRAVVATGTAFVLTSAFAYPAVLPVLPSSRFSGSFWADINDVQLDTVGWPEYADQVRAVVDSLPTEQRAHAVIFTSNYGEAGAMRWYDVGLPVYSGHNGYRSWGPPPDDAGPVVVVYQGPPEGEFDDCVLADELTNSSDTDNEEVGAGVWVCSGPGGSWSSAWDGLAHYDA